MPDFPSLSLSSLAELPECRVQIASNEQLLQQFMGAMLTPSYIYIVSLVTAAGLLCLAYSSETHHHLAKPHIIDGIMEACMMQRPWCQITDEERRLNRLLLTFVKSLSYENYHQLLPISENYLICPLVHYLKAGITL